MNAPSFRLWRLILILALCMAISVGSVAAQPAWESDCSAPEMPAALRDSQYQTELLWQYGGSLTAVEVVGDLAFVGVGQRLVILDISAPGAAVVLGQTDLLIGKLNDIEVQGEYVFAVTPSLFRSSGTSVGGALLVFDIQDLAYPQQVAMLETPGDARYLTVDGAFAYVADVSEGVSLLDISDPEHPSFLQFLSRNTAMDLAKVGNYLYIAANDDGLVVLDVTDPLAPVQTFQYVHPTEPYVEHVILAGGRLYTSDIAIVNIFELADPAHPTYRHSLLANDERMSLDTVIGYGSYLYAFDANIGLRVYDASDPQDPVAVNTLTNFAGKSLCGKTAVSGGQMAMPACDGGLEVYQLASPAAPALTKTFAVGGSALNVLLAGTRAYISSSAVGWAGKLSVLEVGSHSQPTLLGVGPTRGRLEAVIGGYAYFYDRYWDDQDVRHYDLNLYDTLNPAQIELAKTVALTGGLNDIAVYGQHAYMLVGGELQVFDISNPANPVQMGELANVSGLALTVKPGVSDPGKLYAYVLYTGDGEGLKILDVTNPTAPMQTGSVLVPRGPLQDIAVQGSYAYILLGNTEISKYDISNPAAPLWVTSGDSSGFGEGKTALVSENYAYLALGFDSLEIFDLAELDRRAYYRVPTSVEDLVVLGDYVLLAAGQSGLFKVWAGPESSAPVTMEGGGQLASPFDGTVVGFPVGAFPEDTEVYHLPRYLPVTPQPALPGRLVGPVFELKTWLFLGGSIGTPADAAQLPFSLAVPYTLDASLGVDESTLALYHWQDEAWVPVAGSSLDLAQQQVSAETDLLGTFAIIGQMTAQQANYLPLIGR